jgi:A/G-specific adenine glycosylase
MDLVATVNRWFAQNKRDLPWRVPGFSAWGILVSEVMLQQTPVRRVVPRLEEWLAAWPAPADLAAADAGDAVRAWGRLGYPRRALRLHACAVAITERHGGVVPDSVEQLLELPGIGDYTARAVAVFAFGQRHPVVDANVRRVLARAVGGQAEPGPPSTRRDLAAMMAVLPADPVVARTASVAFMELGALVCTARAPRCDSCPIAEACLWRRTGSPVYTGRRSAPQKRFEGSDRQVRGLILARLRSEPGLTGTRLQTLWADAEQRTRAMTSLLGDGLAVGDPESGYRLP